MIRCFEGPARKALPAKADPPVTILSPRGEREVHPRLFRLMEWHQQIDQMLRMAQQRSAPDSAELQQLQNSKRRAKRLINRVILRIAYG